MTEQIIKNHLSDVIESFRSYKKLAERAIEQVSDDEFFRAIDAEANSIAAIMKHIGGNLRSRWTDFLTGDGEKPDRNRDSEFIAENDSRESLMEVWENGWQALSSALESLTADDAGKTVRIRGEDFTVTGAINRSMMHTASHIGQIVLLAKHFRSAQWKTLSIPKNKSAEFNQFLSEKQTPGSEKTNYLDAHREFAEKQ